MASYTVTTKTSPLSTAIPPPPPPVGPYPLQPISGIPPPSYVAQAYPERLQGPQISTCSCCSQVPPKPFEQKSPLSPVGQFYTPYTPSFRRTLSADRISTGENGFSTTQSFRRTLSADHIPTGESDRSSPAPSLGGSAFNTPRFSPNALSYRHNPYSALAPVLVLDSTPEVSSKAAAELVLPAATIHKDLLGAVEFVAYPSVRPKSPPPPPKNRDGLARVFLGQLPYRVTDEQLQWMCSLFCESNMYFPERITREDRNGTRQLTGCVHLYTESASAAYMLQGLHKRVLFDNTGVWYARTPEQSNALAQYCDMMRADKTKRPNKMPYTAVCCQQATSTFVPTEEWSTNLGRVM